MSLVGLANLATAGAKMSGRLCLNWNYMTTYGHISYMKEKPLLKLYERWLSILESHVGCADMGVEFFDGGVMAPNSMGQTDMLSGHCLIT